VASRPLNTKELPIGKHKGIRPNRSLYESKHVTVRRQTQAPHGNTLWHKTTPRNRSLNQTVKQ